jgi:membrane protein
MCSLKLELGPSNQLTQFELTNRPDRQPLVLPRCQESAHLMSLSEFWRLLEAAALGWWNDRAMSLGAAIAFFTIFSLAPMLLAAIAIAGLAFGREAAQGAVVGELGGMIGAEPASALEAMIASADDFESGIIGTSVGVLTFIVLVTGAVIELQDDLNLIWKV